MIQWEYEPGRLDYVAAKYGLQGDTVKYDTMHLSDEVQAEKPTWGILKQHDWSMWIGRHHAPKHKRVCWGCLFFTVWHVYERGGHIPKR